jgi:hypothetical protein
MALTKDEIQRHQDGWDGFCLFMKISTTLVVISLALMAVFLV